MLALFDLMNADGTLAESGIQLLPSTPDAGPGQYWVPHVITLAEAQAAKMTQIEAWRDAACVANCSYSVGGTAYNWQADLRSQSLLSSAVTLAASSIAPPPPIWRTADNINVPVALADLQGIAAAIAAQTNTAYGHSWSLKAAVSAATTIAEVDAVVW